MVGDGAWIRRAPARASTTPERSHHFLFIQPDITEPAGAVCPFTVKLTFPHQKLYETDFFDASGTLVRSVFIGPLITKFTNVDSGATAIRNLSGLGVFTYHPMVR
jgi:hypothetical protein